MLEFIKGVKNEAPFYYFEQISKIPRASGNEKAVAKYIYDLALGLGLDVYMDKSYNVFVVKKATSGRENDEPIMLQAHTDMVAEKNVNTMHDFEADPIELIQEGNVLRANGTTLGADDGFGVAIMLAVLANNSLSHPMLECLFTSSEEIGLVGASKFDYNRVKSRRMINLDSAEESTVIIGCCGGIRTELTLPITKSEYNGDGVKITIGGLCGGHSGEDINKGRLNSNILMGKAISHIMNTCEVVISYISGGDKDNAIPRECEAIIAPCDKTNSKLCLKATQELNELLKKEIKANEDNGLFVKVEPVFVDYSFLLDDTKRILRVLSAPNAILKFRAEPPILPETSRNLARVRTNDDDTISIGFSSRSYLESGLGDSIDELNKLSFCVGGACYHHEKYPGWISDKDSKLVLDWQNAFEKICNKRPEATLIHAGLECGLISAELDGLVAISVGCNVHDLHTPQEAMELDSLDRIYEAVIEVLK